MIKYFCDRCGEEIAANRNPQTIEYTYELPEPTDEEIQKEIDAAGLAGVVKPEDVMQLESMVREAAAEITRAAKINKQMVQYINAAIEDRSHGMDGYERVVDDYSQLEALAEMSAQKLVRNLEKFNKRVNGKGFLNVVMCKFKKAKAQENANENQGPSVE